MTEIVPADVGIAPLTTFWIQFITKGDGVVYTYTTVQGFASNTCGGAPCFDQQLAGFPSPSGTTAGPWSATCPDSTGGFHLVYRNRFTTDAASNLDVTVQTGPAPSGPWTTVAHWAVTTLAGGASQTSGCTPVTPPPPVICAYGTEVNPDAAVYTYITDVLVAAVAGALGMGPLGLVALSTMIGAPILFPVCTLVPTMPAALTDADFIGSTGLPNPLHLDKWMSHFTYGVWLFYCRCKAAPSGSPAPNNPPVPTLPPRLQPGPQPTNPCSNSDVCTTLNHIINILTTINLSVTNNNYTHPPPTYTTSTVHSGLTGNGEFAVSGILGLYATITTLPNRAGTIIGHPNRLFDVGHITFGSDQGWYPQQHITSSPWLTLPEFMGNIDKVGYSIPADVVVQLVELVPLQIVLNAAPGT